MALSQLAKFIVQITRRDSGVQLIIVIFSYLSGNRWTILWRDRFLSPFLSFILKIIWFHQNFSWQSNSILQFHFVQFHSCLYTYMYTGQTCRCWEVKLVSVNQYIEQLKLFRVLYFENYFIALNSEIMIIQY